MLWIIPNGAWIVLPSYMVYVLGKEILESMIGGWQRDEGEITTPEREDVR